MELTQFSGSSEQFHLILYFSTKSILKDLADRSEAAKSLILHHMNAKEKFSCALLFSKLESFKLLSNQFEDLWGDRGKHVKMDLLEMKHKLTSLSLSQLQSLM